MELDKVLKADKGFITVGLKRVERNDSNPFVPRNLITIAHFQVKPSFSSRDEYTSFMTMTMSNYTIEIESLIISTCRFSLHLNPGYFELKFYEVFESVYRLQHSFENCFKSGIWTADHSVLLS